MKSSIIILFVAIYSVFLSTSTKAEIIELIPSTNSVILGNTITVDLNISGLGDGVGPSLGAYFLEISYDNSIIDFTDVSFESFLGSPDPMAFETDIIVLDDIGLVSMDVFSFLFEFELDVLQPNQFTLATLSFNAVGVGDSAIDFLFSDISDAAGNSLTPMLIGANIVTTPPSVVSEPSFLLIFGMLVMIFVRKTYQI
jgi:hypothetical protein